MRLFYIGGALVAAMRSSDEHLEEALKRYNDRVAELEVKGTMEELAEALVNRATVLMLLDSTVSSLDDAQEAIDLMQEMASKGKHANVGTFVKAFEIRGELCYGDHNEQMVQDYGVIAGRLGELGDGKDARHYDRNGVIDLCLSCAGDLIDEKFFQESVPFTDHLMKILNGLTDVGSQNDQIEMFNLIGQAKEGLQDAKGAAEAFSAVIMAGSPLYRQSKIDDPMDLIFAYVYRGDMMEKLEDKKSMVADHEAAADLLEELLAEGKLEDKELLVGLHQGLATALMEMGDMKNAELHLVRVVDLGMPQMKEAMEDLGIKKPSQ
jgi:tetratricopeptide (TPR) repeat protein